MSSKKIQIKNTSTKSKAKSESKNQVDKIIGKTDTPPDDIKWKPHPHVSFKDKYEVSNYGEIRNRKTGNIIQNQLKNGYHYHNLRNEEIAQSFRTHIVVAMLFVKNPDKKVNKVVNHIDGNKLNNYFKNLEWTTTQQNNQHAADNGLVKKTTRRVAQYGADGNLIKIFPTITEASNATGASTGSIVGVCKGVCQHAHGFGWKYVDENPNEVEIDPEKEGFKQVQTFPNYWVSKDGKVYSKSFKKFMKFNPHRASGWQVQLTRKKEGGGQIKKTILVHNLVAIYFLKKPKNQEVNCVIHIDGDKKNNNVNNLKWTYIPGVATDLNI